MCEFDMVEIERRIEEIDWDSISDVEWKYNYFGDTCNRKITGGAFTIASTITDSEIKYGVAFCMPQDVYLKEKGKLYASVSLFDETNTIPLTERTWNAITKDILIDIYNKTSKSWVKEVVEKSLDRIGYELVEA